MWGQRDLFSAQVAKFHKTTDWSLFQEGNISAKL